MARRAQIRALGRKRLVRWLGTASKPTLSIALERLRAVFAK
jgi:hypothetical protein